jgi:hypothetical protein
MCPLKICTLAQGIEGAANAIQLSQLNLICRHLVRSRSPPADIPEKRYEQRIEPTLSKTDQTSEQTCRHSKHAKTKN